MKIFKRKNNLFRQLFVTLGMAYFGIAVLMSCLFLSYQYIKLEKDQLKIIKVFSKSLLPQLSEFIWTENREGIKKLITGASNFPFIKSLNVTDDDNSSFGKFEGFSHYYSFVKKFEKERKIVFKIKKDNEALGILSITMTNLTILRPLIEYMGLLLLQIFIIGIFLVTVGAYLLNKLILSPVIDLKGQLERIDMDEIESIEFDYPYNNEIRNLQVGINELLKNLMLSKETNDEVIREMANTSQKLTLSQKEIEESFSARTAELKDLLENTDNAKNEAAQGKSLVKNGKNVIIQMDDAMKRIEAANRELGKISVVFHEIQKRTSKINKIVQESRLLSFNAEIEAAHAGIFGLGFAVVAEEMGNLASVSGTIATEINETITKSTEAVAGTLDETNRSVEVGKTNSQECLNSFTDLEVSLNKIFKLIESIEGGDDTF